MTTPSSPTRPKRNVIATRTYQYEAGDRKLTATLYKPLRLRSAPNDWCAEFAISGLRKEIKGRAFGIDSLQALLLAAQALRLRLEGLGVQFSWLGGEAGDSGIPRVIPNSYGLAFSERAEQLVLEEATRFVRAAMKVRRIQRRAHGRRIASVSQK